MLGRSSSADFTVLNVALKTRRKITRILKSTFDPAKVGSGQDGLNLDHSSIIVTDVKRIRNHKQKSKYEKYKDYLQNNINETGKKYDIITRIPRRLATFSRQKLSTEINEFYLFDRTEKVPPNTVEAQTLNPQLSDSNATYGQGIYFTEKFTKADQYADQKNSRVPTGTELTVLLCKVLLGKFMKCPKKDAKKWTEVPKNGRYGYHSVLGAGRGMRFREFVVRHGKQCYPEYLIKYKRVIRRRYPPTDDD